MFVKGDGLHINRLKWCPDAFWPAATKQFYFQDSYSKQDLANLGGGPSEPLVCALSLTNYQDVYLSAK